MKKYALLAATTIGLWFRRRRGPRISSHALSNRDLGETDRGSLNERRLTSFRPDARPY